MILDFFIFLTFRDLRRDDSYKISSYSENMIGPIPEILTILYEMMDMTDAFWGYLDGEKSP